MPGGSISSNGRAVVGAVGADGALVEFGGAVVEPAVPDGGVLDSRVLDSWVLADDVELGDALVEEPIAEVLEPAPVSL